MYAIYYKIKNTYSVLDEGDVSSVLFLYVTGEFDNVSQKNYFFMFEKKRFNASL